MKKLLLILLLFTIKAEAASQANLYLASANAGANDGSSCANAHIYTFFNSSGNWGSGSTQIGPDTFVHLCGTITVPSNTVGLTFQGSGTSGHVITIVFEAGAILQSTNFSGNGAIYTGGTKDYWTIDGGANGVIQNTDNGSSPTFGHQTDSAGIYGPTSTHCEVKNLTISNIYVKNTADSQGGGDALDINYSSDCRIHNNVVHDAQLCSNWSLSGTISNLEIDHNTFYHCNWSTGMGASAVTTTTSIKWHDNECYDWQNWDDESANQFHHNGLFVYMQGGADAGSTINGLQGYNNYFHGDPGVHMTGLFFIEVGVGNGTNVTPQFFNNVSYLNTNVPSNGHIKIGNQNVTAPSIYNNSFQNAVNIGGNCVSLTNITMAVSKNNIFLNCGQAWYIESGGSLAASDYNDYYGNTYLGPGVQENATLSAWQMATGFDSHGINTAPNLSVAFVPNVGSPLISAGVNLTSLSITELDSDKAGVARPASAAWDIGALQYVAPTLGTKRLVIR